MIGAKPSVGQYMGSAVGCTAGEAGQDVAVAECVGEVYQRE